MISCINHLINSVIHHCTECHHPPLICVVNDVSHRPSDLCGVSRQLSLIYRPVNCFGYVRPCQSSTSINNRSSPYERITFKPINPPQLPEQLPDGHVHIHLLISSLSINYLLISSILISYLSTSCLLIHQLPIDQLPINEFPIDLFPADPLPIDQLPITPAPAPTRRCTAALFAPTDDGVWWSSTQGRTSRSVSLSTKRLPGSRPGDRAFLSK